MATRELHSCRQNRRRAARRSLPALVVLAMILQSFAAADPSAPQSPPAEAAEAPREGLAPGIAAPFVAPPAAVGKRVALVIGNSAFAHYPPLKNPVHDAEDMAEHLRGVGFEVIERSDLTSRQIGATLREFRIALEGASVALVFLAGHGMQINGENYFPGVDADISSEEDVPNQSLALRQLLDLLGESRTQLNLLFLDACRDNPFARATRSGTRGLARVEAPSGTLISYATRPGSVARDGAGRNGLYTAQLLLQIDQSRDLPIETVLKRVVAGVKQGSDGQQEPWWEGSMEGEFCFGSCAGSGTGLVEAPAAAGSDAGALVDTRPARVAPAAQPPKPVRPPRPGLQAIKVSLPNLQPLFFTRAFARDQPGSIYKLDGSQAWQWHARTTPGNGGIFSVAESPTGELYFCDATESRIFLWKAGKESVVYQHDAPVKHLAIGPAGRLYFSSVLGTRDNGTIYELNGSKATPYYTLKPDALGGPWSGTFAFDRQGMLWVSSGARRPAGLYRVRYQQLEKIFSTDQSAIMGFSFLDDGSIVFADDAHGVMRLTLPELQLSRLFESPYEGWLTDVKSVQARKP